MSSQCPPQRCLGVDLRLPCLCSVRPFRPAQALHRQIDAQRRVRPQAQVAAGTHGRRSPAAQARLVEPKRELRRERAPSARDDTRAARGTGGIRQQRVQRRRGERPFEPVTFVAKRALPVERRGGRVQPPIARHSRQRPTGLPGREQPRIDVPAQWARAPAPARERDVGMERVDRFARAAPASAKRSLPAQRGRKRARGIARGNRRRRQPRSHVEPTPVDLRRCVPAITRPLEACPRRGTRRACRQLEGFDLHAIATITSATFERCAGGERGQYRRRARAARGGRISAKLPIDVERLATDTALAAQSHRTSERRGRNATSREQIGPHGRQHAFEAPHTALPFTARAHLARRLAAHGERGADVLQTPTRVFAHRARHDACQWHAPIGPATGQRVAQVDVDAIGRLRRRHPSRPADVGARQARKQRRRVEVGESGIERAHRGRRKRRDHRAQSGRLFARFQAAIDFDRRQGAAEHEPDADLRRVTPINERHAARGLPLAAHRHRRRRTDLRLARYGEPFERGALQREAMLPGAQIERCDDVAHRRPRRLAALVGHAHFQTADLDALDGQRERQRKVARHRRRRRIGSRMQRQDNSIGVQSTDANVALPPSGAGIDATRHANQFEARIVAGEEDAFGRKLTLHLPARRNDHDATTRGPGRLLPEPSLARFAHDHHGDEQRKQHRRQQRRRQPPPGEAPRPRRRQIGRGLLHQNVTPTAKSRRNLRTSWP